MHILYAYFQSDDKPIGKFEKELFFSINKSYELYHLFFLLVIDIRDYAGTKIEMGRGKHIPTAEDLNPNTRFLNNKVISQLDSNRHLKAYCNDHKITWVNYPEFIKRMCLSLFESDFYKNYMAQAKCSYKDDKKLVNNIFSLLLAEMDEIYQILEDQSIYWNDDVEFVLSMNIRTITDFKEGDGEFSPLLPLFKNDDDKNFVTRLFQTVISKDEEFTKLIENNSENWDIERIAFIDIVLMKMAISEILEFSNIPVKVSLNEYIDLAKLYSTDKSNLFINGILDKIISSLNRDKKIIKSGRGLIETNVNE